MSINWTNGRIKGFITSTLRRGWSRWPPKYTTLKSAFVGKKINKKTNKLCSHYLCNKCKKEYPSSEVQVDHIKPVVDPKTGFVDWNTFVDRLFCPEENLQVLCSTCHDKKTTLERKKRVKKT